jgi:hypothetical protein
MALFAAMLADSCCRIGRLAVDGTGSSRRSVVRRKKKTMWKVVPISSGIGCKVSIFVLERG